MFQINVCVLQASLVEEMISMSALERVRELTCVSVLAICLDSLHCQLLINNHSHKALEVCIELRHPLIDSVYNTFICSNILHLPCIF